MLQQDAQIKSITQMTLPETAIKRDGSIYPFALYKIEMVLDNLHLTEHEADILPSILKKLNGVKQTSTKDIADAFVQTLTELGFDDEAMIQRLLMKTPIKTHVFFQLSVI